MTMQQNSPRRSTSYSPEFALLGLLSQAPAHGYELHQKLSEQLGEIWHGSLSQTYNILTRLELQGYIDGSTQAQDKRPDKRPLRLTTTGRDRFETWIQSTSSCSVRAIRIEFMTRLHFLQARNPVEAQQAIDVQIRAVKKFLDDLDARLAQQPPGQTFNFLAMSLRLSQLKTLLEWLEQCKNMLAKQV